MLKDKGGLLVLLFSVIVFLILLFTLKDYGINWDEPWHYFRGQAYFHYLTTGRTNYEDITGRRSFFQNDSYNGIYFLKTDSAHPPANDILASLFNEVFFRKLDILGDIDSYHLFIIVTSFVAVLAVSLFAYESLGLLGALVAGLSLVLYPLFFSEGHFNIKDPVEMSFFVMVIWTFWKSLQRWNWKWLFLSLLSCGLALGTKFNIVFLPFILLPYLLVRFWQDVKRGGDWFRRIPASFKICFVLSPLIVGSVFIFFWPFLWHDTVKNFIDAVVYYRDIGTGQANFPGYTIAGLDLYPIFWIISTTPPLTLVLGLIGIAGVFLRRKEKDNVGFLWLLWLIIPIARVTMPGTTIYGGIRQIFEYIPALSLLSGLGAKVWFDFVKPGFKNIAVFILLILFIPQIVVLIRLHPNENVYFNFLVGGLPGAVQKNIPYWGNSYGNAYWQAIKWINAYTEKNARLGLVQGTGLNIPPIQLRKDIQFSNANWTGIFRGGEYLTELTFNSGINPYPYAWEYVNKILDPVYEIKADGIPIAKVWKNDLAHTNDQFKKPESRLLNYNYTTLKNEVDVVFGDNVELTRFFLHYKLDKNCSGVSAQVETSIDGKTYVSEQERMPNIQVTVSNLGPNTSPFFFAARDLRYLRVVTLDSNSCLLNGVSFEFWGFK